MFGATSIGKLPLQDIAEVEEFELGLQRLLGFEELPIALKTVDFVDVVKLPLDLRKRPLAGFSAGDDLLRPSRVPVPFEMWE